MTTMRYLRLGANTNVVEFGIPRICFRLNDEDRLQKSTTSRIKETA